MQFKLSKTKHQKGMSLVELMIASTVSLFLVAGVLQLFASNRQAFQTVSGMARLQENARMANVFLSREIRMANHAGCRYFNDGAMSVTNLVTTSGQSNAFLWDLEEDNMIGLEFTGGSWQSSATIPANLISSLQNLDTGSDIILIRRMSTAIATLKTPHAGGSASITFHDFALPATAKEMEIKNGNIYVINDCSSNIVAFQLQSHSSSAGNNQSTLTAGNGPSSPGNTDPQIPVAIPAGAELSTLETSIFYVAIVNGVRTLMRAYLQNNSGTAQYASEDLVRGIDSLQILYGTDTDSDSFADQYHTANTVPDWDNVASVHLTFTASSVDSVGSGVSWNAGTTANSGNLWGALEGINVTSGTLMRRFTNVIDLRNPPKN